MFTYYSKRSDRLRTVELDVRAVMHARMSGMSWDAIYEKGFGSGCCPATLTDVRRSPEWLLELERFATEFGYDIGTVVLTVRGRLSVRPPVERARRARH